MVGPEAAIAVMWSHSKESLEKLKEQKQISPKSLWKECSLADTLLLDFRSPEQ